MSRNHLVCALIGVTLFAVAWPAPGVFFGTTVNGQSPMQLFLVIMVFLASGLKLKAGLLRICMHLLLIVVVAVYVVDLVVAYLYDDLSGQRTQA
jgi:hypothetical protein